ncbi:hypothetical protein RSOL_332920, partial [Rhizoctonia solani AG-3 Rhs1AP]
MILTILTVKYCENGDVPPVGSYVSLSGPIWMPEGSDGSIEADILEVVATNGALGLNLPSPSVYAIGTVATVINRDIYMDVGAYSRSSHSLVTYQIIVTVPNNPRRANMKLPQPGSNVSVRGILSYIAVHEDIMAIELENLTYLPRTDFSSRDKSSPGGKTKRQLIAEKSSEPIDTGRPMKKTKSGPIEAFTPEELGAGSSSGSSAGSSSGTKAGGSSQSDTESTSQSSVDSSPLSGEAGSTRTTRSTTSKKA